MKFFTPELYAKLNSSDDEVFDRANAEWHSALKSYRGQIELFSALMHKRTRELAASEFHDSEVLSMGVQTAEAIRWTEFQSVDGRPVEFYTFTLLSDMAVTFIYYVLNRTPALVKHDNSMVFSEDGRVWLYDEIKPEPSAIPSGIVGFEMRPSQPAFSHNVLLNNGWELDIPFSEVFISSVPLSLIYSDSFLARSSFKSS